MNGFEVIALAFFVGLVIQLAHLLGFFGKHAREWKAWSFVFIDALNQLQREDNIELRILFTYTVDKDGCLRVRDNYDKSEGFSRTVDVFFYVVGGKKTVEIRSSATHNTFVVHHLVPLIKSGVTVYWLSRGQQSSRLIGGSEIVGSVRTIFAQYVKNPPKIVTPLGSADPRPLPIDSH